MLNLVFFSFFYSNAVYIILGFSVLAIIILFIKNFKNQGKKDSDLIYSQKLKLQNKGIDINLKMQAYERLTILLERTDSFKTLLMIDKKENFIVSACFKKKIGKNMIEVKKGYFKKIKKGLSGYALNGAIYAAEVAHFKKSKTFLTKKTMIFRMPISRSIDIDTIEDFNLAKSLFKKK